MKLDEDYRQQLGALNDAQLRSWARLQRSSWAELSRYVIACHRRYREARAGALPDGVTSEQAAFLIRDYRFVLDQGRECVRYWRRKIRAIEAEVRARGLSDDTFPYVDLSARVTFSRCPSPN